MYVHYYYHVFLLLIERHGVKRLFSKPILVPDLSGGEKLKGTAYIRHIHQPFQYRIAAAAGLPGAVALELAAGN